MHRLPLFLALASALAAAMPARATVLTFDDGTRNAPRLCSFEIGGGGPAQPCTDGLLFSQAYGDQPGVLDVRYDSPRVSPGIAMDRALQWWSSDYNDLFGVLWATGSDLNSEARIDLVPLQAGLEVRLNGFDLGSWPHRVLSTTAEVRDLLTDELLWSFSGAVGENDLHRSFAPDVQSANGLRITWRDSAFNVGIDNVDFSLVDPNEQPVPEPPFTWAAAALAAAWATARRRRAAST